MKPEEQRIAIAEACGWKAPDYGWDRPSLWGFKPTITGFNWEQTPDYLNDMNAMHEAVSYATEHDEEFSRYRYWKTLTDTHGIGGAIDSSAAQRAEAFLKTIGKWEEPHA